MTLFLNTYSNYDTTNAKTSPTSAQNVNYDETKENKGNNKKRQTIAKIADIFVKFCDTIMDVDTFACFDAIFLGKKKSPMRLPFLCFTRMAEPAKQNSNEI